MFYFVYMAKGGYVDGFLISIPKKNTAKYKKMAKEGLAAWMKFGALDYKECRIDDAKPAHVSLTFTKLTASKASDDVWFSFITFKNKTHRNAVNKKVMAFFEKKYGPKEMDMPFDMKRFSYAGFAVEVGA
jgi:uncharacterized protein YbaA (DUF1428 family)